MSKIGLFLGTFFLSVTTLASGIKKGDFVVEQYLQPSIQVVVLVANDGQILLEDNIWYPPQYIFPVVNSFNGISVGDTVVSTYMRRKIQRVIQISSNGRFLLEDNRWYPINFITTIK